MRQPLFIRNHANWRHWLLVLLCCAPAAAFAHGVAKGDARFIESVSGLQLVPYLYLGAKHMVTGYDHLLFLAGVIFFLYRLKDVALYVSLFALGHSITLLLGVLAGLRVNPFAVDAVIGLSVVYKAFENMGGFRALGFNPDTRWAVWLFGLVHGFGLSTKLQDLHLSSDALVPNMIAFNVGVELGQFTALALILLAFTWWRRHESFLRRAFATNVALMTAGFVLCGYQLTGLLLSV
ncbi:MAG TPA: HupE/UreJ family protein [Candidatus Acidoferrum sp.]|nr:HupE/UreJ family protein [Candidatus Acidoferrum sp.]